MRLAYLIVLVALIDGCYSWKQPISGSTWLKKQIVNSVNAGAAVLLTGAAAARAVSGAIKVSSMEETKKAVRYIVEAREATTTMSKLAASSDWQGANEL